MYLLRNHKFKIMFKKLFILVTSLLMFFTVNGQSLNFKDVNSKSYYSSYTSKSGVTYKIGDTLRIGTPYFGKYEFTFIKKWNNPLVLNQGRRINNIIVNIEDIRTRGSKKDGYHVEFITSYPNTMFDYYLIIKFEDAKAVGEIK
jgi:hypothetical protein